MYQISIEKKKYKTCAITGHRTVEKTLDENQVKKALRTLICQGVDTFYNGLAIGFDLLTAKLLLSLQEEYPHIKIYGCVPFYGQERYFGEEDRKLYKKVLSSCEEVIILDNEYHRNSYFKRNDYMVEHADVLLAYCNSPNGGAAYTVRKFEKMKGEENIIFVE